VTLANFPAIFTNTAVITVPTDAVVRYNYVAHNTGNVTLTQHSVVDDKLGNISQATLPLSPNGSASVSITGTPGAAATPGVMITNIATWTGAISITSPSGMVTPTNRVLAGIGVASARVNISGPTTDQDGDGIPDNVEGSGDQEPDAQPNYLDLDSDGDGYDDAVEAGPDPTNPIDRDGNEIPAYLDPDETPDTTVEDEIEGLAINGPAKALAGQVVNFNASVTSGTGISYTWTFGDSEIGVEQNVTHTYAAPGTYVVVVTATNSLGQVQTQSSITIQHGTLMPVIKTVGTGG
jgi:hypothetical protein